MDNLNNQSTCNCSSNNNINSHGLLILDHQGGYHAKFFISWEESISVDNNFYTSRKAWELNGESFPSPYYIAIPIPINAKNLCIKAEGATGLDWQMWTIILDKVALDIVPSRILRLWGTALNQHCSIDPGYSRNNNPDHTIKDYNNINNINYNIDKNVYKDILNNISDDNSNSNINQALIISNNLNMVNDTYGNLILKHQGSYTARFYIFWEEPDCLDNSVIYSQKGWLYNDDTFTAPFNTTILIPLNATNITIKAEGCTSDCFSMWVTILNENGLSMVPQRIIKLFGTPLDQKGFIKPL